MASLALKALAYGAGKIPDSAFEKAPVVGPRYFTPEEKRRMKKDRDSRHKSEQRQSDRTRRRSHRERTPPTDNSDYSAYDDTDYERESRRKSRRQRARSLGRSISRSLSRGRDKRRDRDLDAEMDRKERADRGPEFPPPPQSEYRPYNPADYAPAAAAAGAATGAAMANEDYAPRRSSVNYGYPAQPSSSAQRYTPTAGYTPSPVNSSAPPPAGGYTPYNPANFASPPSASYQVPGNAYPSPPPFYRQKSRSQPDLPQFPPPPNNQVGPYLEPQVYPDSAPSSHSHRRHGEKKHRAKSAGHHGRSRSRVTDQLRSKLDSFDIHDKGLAASVGGALAGGLVGNAVGHGTLSTLVGAAIGGLGGMEFEKRHKEKKAAREGSQVSGHSKVRDSRSRSRHRSRHSHDYSRSPSPTPRKDEYESYSESDSDGHRRAERRRRVSRSSRKRRDADF